MVVSVSTYCNLHSFLPMLFEVFDEHEIEYKYMKQFNKITCKHEKRYLKIIHFVLESNVEFNLWGFNDYYHLRLE